MAGYPYQRLVDTLLVPPQSVAESGRVILRPRYGVNVVLALVAPFAIGGISVLRSCRTCVNPYRLIITR